MALPASLWAGGGGTVWEESAATYPFWQSDTQRRQTACFPVLVGPSIKPKVT